METNRVIDREMLNEVSEIAQVPEKLEVKFDNEEYEIVINGIRCDFCGLLEHPDMAHSIGDVTVCESCYDHYN